MKKILVIGGCNLDIIGTCCGDTIMYDSNIGNINYSFGGVAFNICQNICRLVSGVAFISAVGDDYYSQRVISELNGQGVNVEHLYIKNGQRMSIYNAILDSRGELVLGINDMSILENLSLDYFLKIQHFIDDFPILFFDPNLSIAALEYLADRKAFKVVDGVSVAKVVKLRSILNKIDVLKVNKYEAMALSGLEICDRNDVCRCGEYLINLGVKNVIISLGADGLYYRDRDNLGFCSLGILDIVNVNGAGDGLIAGLMYGFSCGLSLRESLIYGMSLSYLNLMTEYTLYPGLNEALLLETVDKIKEKIKWNN